MWNLKIITLAAFLILFSLYVIIAKPQMHKQFDITDSTYEIIDDSLNNPHLNIDKKNISVVNVPIKNTDTKIDNYLIKQQKIKPQTVSNQFKQSKQQSLKQTSKPQITRVTPKKNESKAQNIEQSISPIYQQKDNTQKQTPTVLTEQEEIIAWNKWRSDLQNKVMKDSNVRAPLGTQFKFSFTVDKYGNMSNVKVWSTTPGYNDYAVRMIKPVLMSYRNTAILKFPTGTKRIITNVDGGFVISRITEYSTPADYHDFEHIKK